MDSRTVDSYQLGEEIGRGGMAVVYRARDRNLERDVALKVLHEHIAQDPDNRERFVREARAVARLHHRNIIQIYGFSGPDSDFGYIAAELIDGPTLRQFFRQAYVAYPEIGVMLCAQIADALEHAHGEGVLHRDIKPENVMIGADGVPRLMDFGLARVLDAQSVTLTGSLLGSPAHMAPEIIEGREYDRRVDIFSLGTILYYLCTGHLPFEGTNPATVLNRILKGDFTPPEQHNPHVLRGLGLIIARTLARDPAQRYATAGEVSRALRAYLGQLGIERAEEEFQRFYAAPDDWMAGAGPRLARALTRRAAERAAEGRSGWATALALCDRALLYEPQSEAALALVAGLARDQRRRQKAAWLVALAMVLVVVAAITAVVGAGQRDRARVAGAISAAQASAARAAEQARAARVAADRGQEAQAAARAGVDTAIRRALEQVAVALRDEGRRAAGEASERLGAAIGAADGRAAAAGRARPPRTGGESPPPEVAAGRPDEPDTTPPAPRRVDVVFHIQPPAAELLINGERRCSVGGRCTAVVPLGRHEVLVRNPQTGMEVRETIDVAEAGAVFRYRVPWRPATLVVESNRPGVVLFNGRRVGRTGRPIDIPIEGLRSTADGTLRVIPDGDFGEPVDRRITLTSGETRREPVQF